MCNLSIQTHGCGIHPRTSYLSICTTHASFPGSENLTPASCPDFTSSSSPPNPSDSVPKNSDRKDSNASSCPECHSLIAAAHGSFTPSTLKWESALLHTETHGGASCAHRTGEILCSPAFRGFMVGGVIPNNHSPLPRWSRDKSAIPDAVTALDIQTFVAKHKGVFEGYKERKSGNRLVLGLWIADMGGGEGERLYIDVSEAFESQFVAVATSVGRGELGMYMMTDDWRDGVKICTRPGSRVERALRGAVREENEEILATLRRSGGGKMKMMGCDEGELEGDAGLGLLTSTRYVEEASIGLQFPFPHISISGEPILQTEVDPTSATQRAGRARMKLGETRPPVFFGRPKRRFTQSLDIGEGGLTLHERVELAAILEERRAERWDIRVGC